MLNCLSTMPVCERCGEHVPVGYACTCPPTADQLIPCEFCEEETRYCWCFDIQLAYAKTSHAQVAAFVAEIFPRRSRSWSTLFAKKTIKKK